MKVVLCVLVCLSVCACDAGSAPFIRPCHAADSACLKSSAQQAVPVLAAGIPSMGIETLDPMRVDRVMTSQAGLDMDFRNTIVKGLRNCEVISLKRDGPNKTYLELKCSVTMIGDYNLGGKLLILPIEGNGKYKIKIRDIYVKIALDIGEKLVNGQKYWSVIRWKHSADVKTGVEFHFQNLFNGNKQLSDTIHEFANSNWKEIFQEVAPPIVKAVVTKIVNESTKLFDNVAISEMALD
ncbi:hypothetical protein O3G_MSEX001522 [Manduca sexta]|uniref:Uncharacterized protein n=2 Tax=Manduca sexta TaxID=7130 RepID=A0A922CCB4_MANSE|nr:hypothetical protein O3G_MSEX001522 [Manduca sexta]